MSPLPNINVDDVDVENGARFVRGVHFQDQFYC